MKRVFLIMVFAGTMYSALGWGFFAHKKINYYAVFLLPPELISFYKTHIDFISEHSVDPDKRRYVLPEEGPRHYIDLDHFAPYPYHSLPRKWEDAVTKFSEDSLRSKGIVPWWLQTMLQKLTTAFKEKNISKILKYSAELGHYMSDAHVPLHAHSNHNGQFSDQLGIHGFWESRIPELLADREWDFFIGPADYIKDPVRFIWKKVMESGAYADSVLHHEKELTRMFPADKKFAFENRNGIISRQYATAFSIAYDKRLKGMIEKRMRQSIYAVASFWYTAWVNAGQPNLKELSQRRFSEEELTEFEMLNQAWKKGITRGREHE